MSSPPASSGQNKVTDETPAEEAQSPASEEPETIGEMIECPNCGHEFTDNHCSECGQEADLSTSIVEAIEGSPGSTSVPVGHLPGRPGAQEKGVTLQNFCPETPQYHGPRGGGCAGQARADHETRAVLTALHDPTE